MTKHLNKIRRALSRMVEKRTRRALRSKQEKHARNRFNAQRASARPAGPDVSHLLRRARRHQSTFVELPAELTLFDGYDAVIKVVDEVRQLATRQSKEVVLDFSRTKHIGPAALLILLAEIYRCRMIEPHAANVTGTYPTHGDLERMLQDMGFFDVLSVKKRLPRQENSFPMEYIKFRTGTRAVGEVAYELQRALFGEAIQLDEAAVVSQRFSEENALDRRDWQR